jgi:transposase
MSVIIGVDPHKGSHTAVAIGRDETRLAKVKVRATRRQVDQLLEWATRFDDRTWAPRVGRRARLPAGPAAPQRWRVGLRRAGDTGGTGAGVGHGTSNKNDPNDAHSVAVAALRAPRLASVTRADHAGVLRLLAKRNNEGELGTRRRAGCMPCEDCGSRLIAPGKYRYCHECSSPRARWRRADRARRARARV